MPQPQLDRADEVTMRLNDVHARTDIGRQRDHNEDSYLVLQDIGVLAVADGMGGLEHGEVASATAIATMRAARITLRDLAEAMDRAPDRAARGAMGQTLEGLANLASMRIQQVTRGAPSGTTLVTAVIAGGHLVIANTGDSRAYLFRGGLLRCLTDDHTVAAARMRAGLITKEEHDASPFQHMLYQALGTTQGEVNPDLFDEPVAKGDIVLLCSDGLTGPLPEPDIARILAETPTLEAATAALVDGANARGGPDNVTVLLARIEDGPEAAQIEGERQAMENASVLAPLGSVDRRLLRHYFDRVTAKDGEELDLSAGLHLLMEGEVASEAQSAANTGVIGIRDFAGAPSPPAKAVGDVRALVLSAEAYDALERRRPLVAARLLRGLLETLAKQ